MDYSKGKWLRHSAGTGTSRVLEGKAADSKCVPRGWQATCHAGVRARPVCAAMLPSAVSEQGTSCAGHRAAAHGPRDSSLRRERSGRVNKIVRWRSGIVACPGGHRAHRLDPRSCHPDRHGRGAAGKRRKRTGEICHSGAAGARSTDQSPERQTAALSFSTIDERHTAARGACAARAAAHASRTSRASCRIPADR